MATIAHSYSKPLTYFDCEPRIEPFRLNKNKVPKTNVDSIAMIQEWQKVFDGDSFLFDYNQIWDHYKDPGYMHCAERIAGDSAALKELGFNGLHSCQFINVGFPSWLPTYTHGLTVWNPGRSFDEIADEYFSAIYGEKGAYARAWLQELYNSPSEKTSIELDKDRYYRCTLNGPEYSDKVEELPRLKVTFSAPKTAEK